MSEPADKTLIDPPFASDYLASRTRFRAAAEAAGFELQAHPIGLTGPRGEELTVDFAVQGDPGAKRVVVVSSGTHGIEGFYGGAVQTAVLENELAKGWRRPAGTRVVFVHAVNPYGFAYIRRVNEDNIDLNRNYLSGTERPVNDGYDALAEVLAPPSLDPDVLQALDARLVAYAAEHGMAAVQAAVSSGQYDHPDGIFYGGRGPARSQEVMFDVLDRHLAGAERVVVLDLHTGLGAWGEVEIICGAGTPEDETERVRTWWGDHPVGIQETGESVSALVRGEWLTAARERLAPSEATVVALEWGTVDLIQVLQALRADNWLHVHGDPTGPAAGAIKSAIRAAFADDDPAWAERVDTCFRDVLTRTFGALAG